MFRRSGEILPLLNESCQFNLDVSEIDVNVFGLFDI